MSLIEFFPNSASTILLLLYLTLVVFLFLLAFTKKMSVVTRIRLNASIIGFMGMALSMVLLLAFQTLFGYIYGWIGLAMACYMAGMALSSLIVTMRLSLLNVRFFLMRLLLAAIIFQVALMPMLLLTKFKNSVLVYLFFFIVAGAFVGAAYPLFCRLYSQETAKHELGSIYAADVLGGAVGALALTLFFVPLTGFMNTMIFSSSLCLLALLVLTSLKLDDSIN